MATYRIAQATDAPAICQFWNTGGRAVIRALYPEEQDVDWRPLVVAQMIRNRTVFVLIEDPGIVAFVQFTRARTDRAIHIDLYAAAPGRPLAAQRLDCRDVMRLVHARLPDDFTIEIPRIHWRARWNGPPADSASSGSRPPI